MLGSYHTRHIKRTDSTLIPNDTIEWTRAAKTAMEKVFIGLARLINRKYEFRLLWEIVLIYLNNVWIYKKGERNKERNNKSLK